MRFGPGRGRTGRGRIGRGGGIGGLGLIAIVVIALLMGVDPMQFLGAVDGGGVPASQQSQPQSGQSPADDPMRNFVAVVLADTEDVWNAQFQSQLGRQYREPKLVLFTNGVRSACGTASSAVGPFYCPGDNQVYLDLDFFRELANRFGAPGDFAQAYVVAHEVGHHVQTLLGISQRVREVQAGLSSADANELSVRQELQADCFAGLWANHAERTQNILEAGDIDEALTAASAIGDDTLQRRGGGQVVPDSFTHGSSAQRQRWFRRGFQDGSIEACDTFAADQL